MLQLIKYTILFNIVAGELVKYTPETFNITLPSGVKYQVTKDVDSWLQRALIEQTVTFKYTVLLIDGEYVKSIGSTTTTNSVSVVLGSNWIPKGES